MSPIIRSHQAPWLLGVKGDEVPVLITATAPFIRVEAGPGTGKTFGLVRRVLRLFHPTGENAGRGDVLVVAFNRVIAKQLGDEIGAALAAAGINERPEIRTVHALCLRVIGEDLRILLPHEQEAMLYDVLVMFPEIHTRLKGYDAAVQALHDHEAGHKEDVQLWQGVQQWLVRHQAALMSDLPRRLLEHIEGGDFGDRRYRFVIVDEFQDLTSAEQSLFQKLTAQGGEFIALGDSRQSIYAFRGNDREGLRRLTQWSEEEGLELIDVPLRRCQRCPPEIVRAANQLMSLAGQEEMLPGSEVVANIRVVHWPTPQAEARGMARQIFANLQAYPNDRHLVMVTRRRFGYWLRDAILELAPTLNLDMGFEEAVLDSWPAREAFLFFSLLADPDRPTWRAWLGYQKPDQKGVFKAAQRNAPAYLRFLEACNDAIDVSDIERLAAEDRKARRGTGGANLWDRATRFLELRKELSPEGLSADVDALAQFFDNEIWLTPPPIKDASGARLDLQFLRDKTIQLLTELDVDDDVPDDEKLRRVARALRYKIGTREAPDTDTQADLEVMTLWGAKGITADHVYLLGLCDEALPGERREEYPGTENEYLEEQRRLFYVSLTRAKKTLFLSRASRIHSGAARQLGLKVVGGGDWVDLRMCRFLRDIRKYLPSSVEGDTLTSASHHLRTP
jgi:DNA helicase-2/ATP-dependent DNA helicase PcrA